MRHRSVRAVAAARRALWIAGWAARMVLIGLVRVYRLTLSAALGGQCRYFPSCSAYAEDAIRNRGAVAGSVLTVWRLLRCNPWSGGGVDHAPAPRRAWQAEAAPGTGRGPARVYETIIQSPRVAR